MTDVHILGVRHHGPGSARTVAAALDQLRPDVVLVEGAPELNAVVALTASAGMVPPVAGLVYAPSQPRRATFYPMAVFSPEWIAVRWALAAGAQVRFADLPAAVALAAAEDDDEGPVRTTGDPLAALAAAAGFDDPERWWEDAIEHRYHGPEAFVAVRDAIAALREDDAAAAWGGPRNAQREAAMRQALRGAIREQARCVAFVCGAWHAPALDADALPPARHDAELLRGLDKVTVTATWVPWTNRRLSFTSGYGAGVTSPGWYHHLYTAPGDVTIRWLARTAALLRDEQLEASPADVVEAVRLADGLAALRGRPLAGLAELTDATESVLCGGSSLPLRLVAERLFVGDDVGCVPDETPMTPLARDLQALQRRLRLKPSAAEKLVTLDLRTPTHLERSQLLHRLRLLGVAWGEQVEAGRTRGTFKEVWRLAWEPELSVALIDASAAGTTIEEAATTTVAERVADADVATLTELVEEALLADLPGALPAVIDALADRSARQHDTNRLMAAVGPLARVSRYGNVRQVDTQAIHGLLRGIAIRACIGLGAACNSLDDDAARAMRDLIDGVHRGLGLVEDGELRDHWHRALAGVADQRDVHGQVAGRAVRILLDARRLEAADAQRRLSRALSAAVDAAASAAWLEGFLSGDATLLLHDAGLLAVIDAWVSEVGPEPFDDLVPVLRRTFGDFSAAERRRIGEQVRRLDGSGAPATRHAHDDDSIDEERAQRVAPVLRAILGGQR